MHLLSVYHVAHNFDGIPFVPAAQSYLYTLHLLKKVILDTIYLSAVRTLQSDICFTSLNEITELD